MVDLKNISQIIADLERGVEHIYSIDELKKKLESKKTLRIKLGMDPTAPDLHLGHTVVLRKMRQFQDLGHKAVLIIGDYTARIGDPTGRDTTRPILDEKAIAQNAKTYLEQAGKILDTHQDKLEVRHNSEWLSKLSFVDVLKLTGQITVQQMLQRENFKKRMADDREILVSEFMYPLMQAYDSVVIEADVELGGTDQTFNNLMGRQLMDKHHLPKQVVMVMPILVGLDGHDKMSKSKGNYIAVMDAPNEMFGKVMSIPDALMANYFELLTDLPADRIASLLDSSATHPRDAKDILGRVIVEAYYGLAEANEASQEFRSRFAKKQLPSDIQTYQVASPIGIIELMREVKFAQSNGEARRLIQQGAVSFNDRKITDPFEKVEIESSSSSSSSENEESSCCSSRCKCDILKVGKRRICQVDTS